MLKSLKHPGVLSRCYGFLVDPSCTNICRTLKVQVNVEATSDPLIQKFSIDVPVTGKPNKTIEFTSNHCARVSPLAMRVFRVPGVGSVSMSDKLITVTKGNRITDWEEMKPKISNAIKDFFASGKPVFTDKRIIDALNTGGDTEVQYIKVSDHTSSDDPAKMEKPPEFEMIDITFYRVGKAGGYE